MRRKNSTRFVGEAKAPAHLFEPILQNLPEAKIGVNCRVNH